MTCYKKFIKNSFQNINILEQITLQNIHKNVPSIVILILRWRWYILKDNNQTRICSIYIVASWDKDKFDIDY